MMPMIALGLLDGCAAAGVAAAAGAVVGFGAGAPVAAAPEVGGEVGVTGVLGVHAANSPDAATRPPRRPRTCRRLMRNSGVIAGAPCSKNVSICYPPRDDQAVAISFDRLGASGTCFSAVWDAHAASGRGCDLVRRIVASGSGCGRDIIAAACPLPVGAGRSAGADRRASADRTDVR